MALLATEEKPLAAGGEPTTNSTHICDAGSGIKPGSHCWKANALTTAPPFLLGHYFAFFSVLYFLFLIPQISYIQVGNNFPCILLNEGLSGGVALMVDG